MFIEICKIKKLECPKNLYETVKCVLEIRASTEKEYDIGVGNSTIVTEMIEFLLQTCSDSQKFFASYYNLYVL